MYSRCRPTPWPKTSTAGFGSNSRCSRRIDIEKGALMPAKHAVENLSDYIKAVTLIQQRWTEEDGEFIYPWFRGQPNNGKSLLPGLYRKENLWKYEFNFR